MSIKSNLTRTFCWGRQSPVTLARYDPCSSAASNPRAGRPTAPADCDVGASPGAVRHNAERAQRSALGSAARGHRLNRRRGLAARPQTAELVFVQLRKGLVELHSEVQHLLVGVRHVGGDDAGLMLLLR